MNISIAFIIGSIVGIIFYFINKFLIKRLNLYPQDGGDLIKGIPEKFILAFTLSISMGLHWPLKKTDYFLLPIPFLSWISALGCLAFLFKKKPDFSKKKTRLYWIFMFIFLFVSISFSYTFVICKIFVSQSSLYHFKFFYS